jgi:hypothetical protein
MIYIGVPIGFLAVAAAVIFIRRRYRIFLAFGTEADCERRLVGRTYK